MQIKNNILFNLKKILPFNQAKIYENEDEILTEFKKVK